MDEGKLPQSSRVFIARFRMGPNLALPQILNQEFLRDPCLPHLHHHSSSYGKMPSEPQQGLQPHPCSACVWSCFGSCTNR